MMNYKDVDTSIRNGYSAFNERAIFTSVRARAHYALIELAINARRSGIFTTQCEYGARWKWYGSGIEARNKFIYWARLAKLSKES